MSEVPASAGHDDLRDDISDSSGDIALSDPSDTDETGSEEEFRAEDYLVEEVHRATQDRDEDSPHADPHDAEVAEYFARHRPQGEEQEEQKPKSDFAAAAEVLDDSELELAGDEAGSTTADNGHSVAADDETAGSTTENTGDHEQAAEVPALTAETQQDAVLPSVEAASADIASQPEPEPAEQSQAAEEDTPVDEDRSGEADQQPADTRPSFADIQKVLDQGASQNVEPESEANSGGEPEGDSGEAEAQAHNGESEATQHQSPLPEISLTQEGGVADSEASSEPEAEQARTAAPTEQEPELEQTQAASTESAERAESHSSGQSEAARTVESATAESSSVGGEKPSGSSMPRLPSLPVRRGAPTLPSRTPASTDSTSSTSAPSAPTVSSQQQAAPPSQTANNGPATGSKPTPTPTLKPPPTPAPTANNGRTHATEATSGNGNGSPSGATASTPAAPVSSSSQPAVNSSGGDAGPAKQPVGNANPSIPPRPAGSANPSIPPRPAGSANPSIPPRSTGSANPSIPPRPQAANPSPAGPPRQPAGNGQVAAVAAPAAAPAADEEPDENRELREKVQSFRVLLVRLTLRLGQSTRGSIVQQVNYRLDLAERIRLPHTSSATRRAYGFEAACRQAEQVEGRAADQPLPFACTVMVIGMSGVGKSATINSLLDAEEAAPTNAFEPGTSGVKEINGTVAGVRVKFIDTPGLQPSAANIGSNQRLLNQMHSAFKKHKPDIMLYMDRADVLRTDMADVPLLTAITETFGPNMWFNTIVALTHAAAAPPDGSSGPISYDTYTRTRTQLLQQNIRQASGDMRLLNPVALVENHPACRKNDRGYAVLPNQLAWKPHLVLLLLSSKLLSDTDALLKIQQDSSAGDAQRRAMRMLLAGRKMPPIPYLINSFIQKKSPRKPPDEERMFKHDSELKDLSQQDRKEEMRRRREYSRMRADEAKAEAGANQAGVPAPDIPLQPTFDPENNTSRYRYMEPPPDAAICRPVVDANGVDHDDGMHAFTVEKSGVVRKKGTYVGGAPGYVMAQVHKDKDMFNIVSEAEASYYHTHKLISTASCDAQTVQTDALFTGKLETRFKNHPKNKTAAGILVSRLKEDGGLPTKGPVVYGGKIEDRFKPTDKVKVVLASATLMNKTDGRSGREQAWNHSAETRIKAGEDDKLLVSVGLNNMRYRGKSGYGGNVAAQYAATQGTTVASNIQLNSERAGKMSLRVTSHDRPQLGFSLLLPVVGMILGKIRGRE